MYKWFGMMKSNYDLVVIGAGTAGTLAAFAAKEEGLENVLLIDRKSRENIGRKICGDGVGAKHMTFLQEQGFPIKEQSVVKNKIALAKIVAPNSKVVSRIPVLGHLVILNRYQFGQTLLEHTLAEGVTLMDKTTFSDIKRENGEVKIALTKAGHKSEVITTPLVIDASGINSKIRENANFFAPENSLADDEQYYCYREIAKIPSLPLKYRQTAIFEFSFERTRGGYLWFFSRGNGELNMGCGIPKSWIKQINPKEVFQRYIASRFKKYQILDAGGSFVPTRQPLPSFVKDNIILVGDAGTLVNPIHGGGLSPSLNGGFLAGKIAAQKITEEAVTEADLWPYNIKIVERYCQRYAILDLYRILLQNIPDEELLQALEKGYFPLGKIFYARKYEKLLALSRKLGEQWAQLPDPRFNLLPEYLESIHTLTSNYPATPTELDSWATKYRSIYRSYQQKVQFTP